MKVAWTPTFERAQVGLSQPAVRRCTPPSEDMIIGHESTATAESNTIAPPSQWAPVCWFEYPLAFPQRTAPP